VESDAATGIHSQGKDQLLKVSTTPAPDGMVREMGEEGTTEIERLGEGVGRGR